MPGTKNPASRSDAASRIVRSGIANDDRNDLALRLPVFQPCSRSRTRKSAAARQQLRHDDAVRSRTMSSAAIAAALVAAGCAVENTYVRARFASQSISDCRPQTNPPPAAQRLAQRAMRM